MDEWDTLRDKVSEKLANFCFQKHKNDPDGYAQCMINAVERIVKFG